MWRSFVFWSGDPLEIERTPNTLPATGEYELPNIYYDPEKFGLEVFGEVDFGGSFEYDKLVVWRDRKTGELYTGEDSGCSCPSPFESQGLDNLTPLLSLKRLESKLDGMSEKAHVPQSQEIANLLERLHKAGLR